MAVIQRVSSRKHKELGKKLNTELFVGHLSIKMYEKGIELKPYSQERIALTLQEEEMLFNVLRRRKEKREFMEEL